MDINGYGENGLTQGQAFASDEEVLGSSGDVKDMDISQDNISENDNRSDGNYDVKEEGASDDGDGINDISVEVKEMDISRDNISEGEKEIGDGSVDDIDGNEKGVGNVGTAKDDNIKNPENTPDQPATDNPKDIKIDDGEVKNGDWKEVIEKENNLSDDSGEKTTIIKDDDKVISIGSTGEIKNPENTPDQPATDNPKDIKIDDGEVKNGDWKEVIEKENNLSDDSGEKTTTIEEVGNSLSCEVKWSLRICKEVYSPAEKLLAGNGKAPNYHNTEGTGGSLTFESFTKMFNWLTQNGVFRDFDESGVVNIIDLGSEMGRFVSFFGMLSDRAVVVGIESGKAKHTAAINYMKQVVKKALHDAHIFPVLGNILDIKTLESFHIAYSFDSAMDMTTVEHINHLYRISHSLTWVITSAKDGSSPILDDSTFSVISQFKGKMCTSGELKTLYLLKRNSVSSSLPQDKDPIFTEAFSFAQYNRDQLLSVYEAELQRLYSESPIREAIVGSCKQCNRKVDQSAVVYESATDTTNTAQTLCLPCQNPTKRKWTIYCMLGCGIFWFVPKADTKYPQRRRVGECRHDFIDANYLESIEPCEACKKLDTSTTSPNSLSALGELSSNKSNRKKPSVARDEDPDLKNFIDLCYNKLIFSVDKPGEIPTHKDVTEKILGSDARRKVFMISQRGHVPEQISQLREATDRFNARKGTSKLCSGYQCTIKNYCFNVLTPIKIDGTLIVAIYITPQRVAKALMIHDGQVIESHDNFNNLFEGALLEAFRSDPNNTDFISDAFIHDNVECDAMLTAWYTTYPSTKSGNDYDKLLEDYAKARQQIDILKLALTKEQKAVTAQKNKVKELESDLIKARKEVKQDKTEKKNIQLTSALKAKEAELLAKNKEIKAMEDTLVKKSDKVDELTNKNTSLTKSVATAVKEAEVKLKQEHQATLKQLLSDLKVELKQKYKEENKKKVEELKERISELTSELKQKCADMQVELKQKDEEMKAELKKKDDEFKGFLMDSISGQAVHNPYKRCRSDADSQAAMLAFQACIMQQQQQQIQQQQQQQQIQQQQQLLFAQPTIGNLLQTLQASMQHQASSQSAAPTHTTQFQQMLAAAQRQTQPQQSTQPSLMQQQLSMLFPGMSGSQSNM